MSDTVTVWIDSDEWYPVYGLDLDPSDYGRKWDPSIEVPRSFLRRYQRTLAAFERLQDELRELDDKARAARPPKPSPFQGVPTSGPLHLTVWPADEQ